MRAIVALLVFLPIWQVFAQPIPLDPAVRTGKLKNGMTYYIRQNAKPENKVELRLAVNVGSILENEKQLGLAHFTEHMCFNGTKNFEKNELVSYLQSLGIRFGADLNAYTSFDETVYILPIQSDDEVILDKGLLVLEDWASRVTFADEEIDKERGVVIEEWRMGRGASQRMRDKYFPILFQGSRYAERLPIGTLEVLETFSYQTIRDFYKTWYRPDLMAIIAVGDIDPDAMEKKIKERFGRIPTAKKPQPRLSYPVPGHKETLVSVQRDPEQPFTQIQLIYKHDPKPVKTSADFRQTLVNDLYNGMLNTRLGELRQSADPPFINGSAYYGSLIRTKDAYQSFAIVSENGIEKGLKALVRENERVKRYGFTPGEFERYKKVMLSNYERQFNERDKTESRAFAGEYIRHFLSQEPIPGIAFEFDFVKQQLPTITLEEVNRLATQWITQENRVVIITGPEKEGLNGPENAQVMAWLAEVAKETVTPYEDKALASSLMEQLPTPGSVTSVKAMEKIGTAELTFANGVKVVLKPTDFKNDEILLNAFKMGGGSLFPDKDQHSTNFAAQVINLSGIADFSATDLQKMMTGNTAKVSPYLSQYRQGFTGSTAPKDLETMLQMVHLYMTAPRKDPAAFQGFVANNKALYQNLMSSPQFYYSDQVSQLLTNNHPRGGGFPKPDDFDQIDLDRVMDIFQASFGNANGFTFFFTGNFQMETIVPMLERYLGSLPAQAVASNFQDLGIRPPKGIIRKDIRKGTDQKSMVTIFMGGEATYDRQDAYHVRCIGEILSIKLIEQLREEKGGVYSVGARASMSKIPYGSYSMNISFPTSVDKVEDLIKAALTELEKIKKEGPKPADLAKIKEAQKKEYQENLKQNNFWNSVLEDSYYTGFDPEEILGAEARIDQLTAEALQKAANIFFDGQNMITAVLLPEDEAR